MTETGLKYDFIVEASEQFLNRSLKQVYEANAITKVYKGKYELKLPKIFNDFEPITYEITLNEPLKVDALNNENISIYFSAEIKLSVNIFMIPAKIRGLIESKPNYNRGKTLLDLNIQNIHIDKASITDTFSIQPIILGTINETLRDIVKEGLKDLDNIPLPPIIGDLSLPDMPEGRENLLPISLGEIYVLDENNLTLAFDIDTNGEGTKAPLKTINKANDLSITISSIAVNKVLDFWWPRTTYDKKHRFTGRIRFKNIDEIMNYLSNFSIELLPKLVSFGFIEIDWNLLDIWLDYEVHVSLIKPRIKLLEDSLSLEAVTIVDISAVLRVNLDVALKFDTSGPIPDALTPWKDDHVVGETNRVLDILRFSEKEKRVELVNAEASIFVGPEQRIRLNLESFDLDLGLNWRLPRRLIKRLEKNLEKHIMDAFPSIPLSPAVVQHNLEGTDLSYDLEIKSITNRLNLIEIKTNLKLNTREI